MIHYDIIISEDIARYTRAHLRGRTCQNVYLLLNDIFIIIIFVFEHVNNTVTYIDIQEKIISNILFLRLGICHSSICGVQLYRIPGDWNGLLYHVLQY